MATAVRAQFCSGGTGVFFLGSWREVAGMTVRKRTILVVVCGLGALRYMFLSPALPATGLCGSPPLWTIVFDVHLRACATPIAHGVGSYKIQPWPVTLC